MTTTKNSPTLDEQVQCPLCQGSGLEPGTVVRTFAHGHGHEQDSCLNCAGTGVIDAESPGRQDEPENIEGRGN